MKLVSEQRA